jgi:hypothetical protein
MGVRFCTFKLSNAVDKSIASSSRYGRLALAFTSIAKRVRELCFCGFGVGASAAQSRSPTRAGMRPRA